ncbi:MAG: hypothetical protein R6U19_01520 [Bacteroidales bacterium]
MKAQILSMLLAGYLKCQYIIIPRPDPDSYREVIARLLVLFLGGEGVAGLPIDTLEDEVFAGGAHYAAAQFSEIICDRGTEHQDKINNIFV